MLTFLRNMLGNRIIGGFFIVLLVLAFAFFAVPDLNNFAQSSPLKVGKRNYSAADIQDEFNRQIENFRRETGQQITRDEAARYGLTERTINALAYRGALKQEIDGLNLTVTTEMLQDYLQSLPGLQNPRTGKFDSEALSFILREYEMSIGEFRQVMRDELIRNHLTSSLNAPMAAPEAFVDAYLLQAAEQRDLSIIVVSPTDLGELPAATEEELQTYYQDNAEDFTAPEYRTFRVLMLKSEDFKEGLEVSEEELRQLFELQRSRLEVPETRTFTQLTYSTDEEANAALARLNTGTPFEALAEERGLDLATVTFEGAQQSELDTDIGNAVFALENAGDIADPISGVFGTTIVQLLSITEGTTTTFEEQREALETEALQEQTRDRILNVIEQIELARDEGATIEDAVAEIDGIGLTAFGPVDRNLFTPGGAIVDGLETAALEEAFRLEPGDESELTELDNDAGYFAVIVDDITNPALRPFEEVRASVVSGWEGERNRSVVSEKINALKALIEGGTDIASAATQESVELQTVALTREAAAPVLPRTLSDKVFHAKIGELITEVSPEGRAGFAVMVNGASFPPSLQGDLLRGLYRENGGQIISQGLADAYIQTLRDDLGIKRNDERLAGIFGAEQQ
jgi:peptidyl-prolyl cis-trans isomerase D